MATGKQWVTVTRLLFNCKIIVSHINVRQSLSDFGDIDIETEI